MNSHEVSGRWFAETDVQHFKVVHYEQSQIPLKEKEFLRRCISNILFIDNGKVSKMQTSS